MACWRSRRSRSATLGVLDRDHAALAGGDHLARVQREAGERARASRSAAPGSARRSRTRRPRRARGRGARRAPRNGSMSAGRPSWCTGMIAFVRLVIARSAAAGIEVVGARVDVGEHRRGAALPDRVGGRDERHRGHDHLVARADAATRRARAAAPWCSSWSRPRRRRRRARRTPPRTRARAGPARPSRRRSPRRRPRPRRRAGSGLLNGISIRTPSPASAVGLVGRAGALAAPPLDEAREALLEVDLGLEAELARGQRSVSASRRVTPLTARAGPCSTGRSEPITRSSICGELEQARLGPAGDVEDDVGERRTAAASMFARAMSPM